MKQLEERHKFWHNPQLDLSLLHARHVEYAYPRHTHEEYVICLVEWGVQSFTHKKTKYVTPPSGLIFINPSVVHTGEPASTQGFQMRSIYPSVAHMQSAIYELTGRHYAGVPYFKEIRVDDSAATQQVFALHEALTNDISSLEIESRFITTLGYLIKRYGDIYGTAQQLGQERRAVQEVRHYLEAHFAERVTLSDLAQQVALSPYYLLRVFQAEVGMPPHAYLQDVRIRRAQRLIELGHSLVDVAFAVGYSSQSHLTRRFKQIVGVTPGQYAAQVLNKGGRLQ